MAPDRTVRVPIAVFEIERSMLLRYSGQTSLYQVIGPTSTSLADCGRRRARGADRTNYENERRCATFEASYARAVRKTHSFRRIRRASVGPSFAFFIVHDPLGGS